MVDKEIDFTRLKLDNETALTMAQQGGAVLLLGVPPRTTFTVDYVTYTTADKFQGVKMLPPGVHFLAYSPALTARDDPGATTGVFYDFQPQEVCVFDDAFAPIAHFCQLCTFFCFRLCHPLF